MERPDTESTAPSAPDRAFFATYAFQGQPLKGFSARREITARACGHRLLSGLARMKGKTAYDGAFFDIALVIWLCTLEHDQLDNALRDPAAAASAVLDWTEESGLSFGSEMFNEALGIHFSIISDIFESRFSIVENSGGKRQKPRANRPSYGWLAEYVGMVCSVSKSKADYVEYDMPLAQGLQLQALWLETQGNEVQPLGGDLNKVSSFEQIAGLACRSRGHLGRRSSTGGR